MEPLGPLVVVGSAVEGRKKKISWKGVDAEDFEQLTCGAFISTRTRLGLGWRVVRRRRRRGLLEARRRRWLLVARRWLVLLVVRRRLLDVGRSGDLWRGG